MTKVLAIGKFDGLHLGHQKIFAETKRLASETFSKSAVLTFSPHPAAVIHPEKKFLYIYSDEQKAQLVHEFGIDELIVQSFTIEFASLSPDDFVNRILIDKLKVNHVVVGYNFRFGHYAQGNTNLLQNLLGRCGAKVSIIQPVIMDGEVCSSGLIRTCISNGSVEKAGKILGEPFFIEGEVLAGEKRGRQIGFPTANIAPSFGINPKPGVYATKVEFSNRQKFFGATNIGYRPTFGDSKKMSIETHVLGFSKDIYGQKIRVYFIKQIRDEMKFDSVENLKRQIGVDVEAVRVIFAHSEEY